MHDYKVSQIITEHLNISIIQILQIYKNRSLSHTQKYDHTRAKAQYDLSGMELCFPTSSWPFKTQDTGYHLTIKNTEVNQPEGLCGWRKKKKEKKSATTFTDKRYALV